MLKNEGYSAIKKATKEHVQTAIELFEKETVCRFDVLQRIIPVICESLVN